ncbi:flagellar hook-length control protein FliK [Treponema vincentii]|uniref:flagellar hook-length control protein FliK n=1 Tax=Treponema vincentii TaxID=69710 RepID=UPI003D92B631
MQTLDVQNDMQPVNYTEAVQSSNQDKKNAKEPDVKGASFMDIITKLMAEETDGRMAGKITPDDSAELSQDAAEQTGRKKNDAVQTTLSRLKAKGGKQNDAHIQKLAETDAREAEAAELLLDADALLTSEEGIDVKNALENGADKQLQTSMFAQAETDAVPEGAALLSAEEAQLLKKQKNGKAESGVAIGISAPGTEELSGKQKKNTDEPAADHSLEKSTKAQQVKQHKPVFTIIDERTVNAAPVVADGSVHEAGAAVRVTNAPSVDMAADFRSMTAGLGTAANGTQGAQESGAPSFASLVAQQVQDMAPDFVQAGRIVLQDNNAGVIRLQMQPAHLGNVRINLELAGGKKIVGKIITGSKEAYEAFKESIEQLAKAFEQGGFASAQFDVSWSGEGGGRQFDGENGQFNELFAQNDRLEVMQGNRYADTETVYAFGQDQAVNVFA